MGISHPEVGCGIARQWNFSESIAQSILHHHNPEECKDLITDAIHICNISAKTIGIGLGNEECNLIGSANSAIRLGLSRKDFERICFAINEKLPEVEKLYDL